MGMRHPPIDVNDIHVSARGLVDTELLSQSDMVCLLDASRKFGTMSFSKLQKLSRQGRAFENADPNAEMKLADHFLILTSLAPLVV